MKYSLSIQPARRASMKGCPTCQKLDAHFALTHLNDPDNTDGLLRIMHDRYVHQREAHGIPLWDEPEQLELEGAV